MMERGDYGSAKDLFQKAVRMNDNDYVAHYLLGRSLFHLKEYDSSEKELQRTIQLQPTRHPVAYVYLGDIAFARNDMQKAKEYWRKHTSLTLRFQAWIKGWQKLIMTRRWKKASFNTIPFTLR